VNRRAFFCRAASLLPLPAFVRAASLWLPKERAQVVRMPKIILEGSYYLRKGDCWTFANDDTFVVLLPFPELERIRLSGGVKLSMGPDGWEYLKGE
jgi:hypothetical protein